MFCCFANQSQNCMAFTGLGSSIVAFAFMIWGIADLWFRRKGVEVIYIIAFVLVCLCLVGFILIFIFLNLRKTDSYMTFINFGKVICLIILFLCFIAFVFLLVAFIILIVDYADLEKDLGPGRQIPSHDWAAVFLPSLLGLICIAVMALAANVLYKVFLEKLKPNSVYPVQITQNSVTTIPNPPQPVIFPVNNGPVPPVGNNLPYPGVVQSGLNLNK